jgi:hypothetical protein
MTSFNNTLKKHDRQCTYVTLRRVRVTAVPVNDKLKTFQMKTKSISPFFVVLVTSLSTTYTYLGITLTDILLSDFNQTWIFSTEFHKSIQYQILRKSVQWEPGAKLTQTAERHDEAQRDYVNAPTKKDQKPQLVESRYVAKRYPLNEPCSPSQSMFHDSIQTTGLHMPTM